MELSVVVSTLNDREQLLSCLDALADRTPSSTEIIVVNGPSSDGTTGTVRERDDVDVLVEISERNRSVSRNAGLEVATGDVIAFLDGEYAIDTDWYSAIDDAITTETAIVTGPVTGGPVGTADQSSQRIAGRTVTLFHGENVAFERSVLEAIDGFDEYLAEESERDCAHRVATMGCEVTWSESMAARCEVGTDGGRADPDWGATYRSLSYRLAKNYGPRPSVLARTAGSALRDGLSGVYRLASGDATPTGWVSDGTDVVTNIARGLWDGVRARYADRSTQRNPNGISERHDRAVQIYDRR
ncbi:glycosyltransferase family 2 protein [Natrinema longum]|uniref:Glycosyltransferase family 2 protein n=1 Tax=Natrinema longum TaxID=370324 RepID=A0A8A2U826_9EURY|nr:glycosyltransferase family 2 protein [Natrinema longum]MBZ6493813.1 glycosyltransferase family 2 protein [Natrinema longum]QSW84850.1 glycosyltransferase family 2 protein [Natrinema longum]